MQKKPVSKPHCRNMALAWTFTSLIWIARLAAGSTAAASNPLLLLSLAAAGGTLLCCFLWWRLFFTYDKRYPPQPETTRQRQME